MNQPLRPKHDALLRMIDANANRAQEAARVLEDLARFMITVPTSAAELSREGKAIRHGLRTWLDHVDPRADRVVLARDTMNDPGTQHATQAEHDRSGARGVALAAGSRLGEALRVLEEAAKLLANGRAADIEALRYRGYTLCQAVVRTLAPRCPQWSLCVLLTESLCTHHTWLEVARAAISGGSDCVQLREKALSDRELLARARALVKLSHDELRRNAAHHTNRCAVIINDRPDIAALSNADGVHLGQDDMAIADARAIVGSRWIGVSTANLDQAARAIAAGADSVGLGPMFASGTKPKDTLSGPEYLRAFLADTALSGVPHLAISGIDAARAAELASMGCRGVAVSAAVCSASDPERAARTIRDAVCKV